DDLVVTIDDPLTFARWHLGLVEWPAALRSGGIQLSGARALRRGAPARDAPCRPGTPARRRAPGGARSWARRPRRSAADHLEAAGGSGAVGGGGRGAQEPPEAVGLLVELPPVVGVQRAEGLDRHLDAVVAALVGPDAGDRPVDQDHRGDPAGLAEHAVLEARVDQRRARPGAGDVDVEHWQEPGRRRWRSGRLHAG